MWKLNYILCDRCRKIIATDYILNWYSIYEPFWETVQKSRRMDFCNEKCRIYFFKGRKYYRQSQEKRLFIK